MQPASVALVICSILFPALALLVLCLRLIARRSKHVGVQLEDWLICSAWVIATAMGIANIVGVFDGHFGEDFSTITNDELTVFTKILFAMQFFHLFSMAFIKYSFLVFYKRIFPTRSFVLAANGVVGVVTLWLAAFFFTTLFQAWPISTNWTGQGRQLIDEPMMYLALGVVDVITDLFILCLPIPMIIRLHADKKKRLFVGAIFSLGFFCVAASCVRVYYLDLMNNTDVNLLNQFGEIVVLYVVWTEVEPCWSIICASLPILLPMFYGHQGLDSVIATLQTMFVLRSRSSHASSRRVNDPQHNMGVAEPDSKKINKASNEDGKENTFAFARVDGSGTRREAYEMDMELDQIDSDGRNEHSGQDHYSNMGAAELSR